jgi:chaperonin GroES
LCEFRGVGHESPHDDGSTVNLAATSQTAGTAQQAGNLCGMPPKDESADDVKHSIRMTADRILALPSKEMGERKSRAGIVIPATAAESRRLGWAKVVAVGPTVRNVEDGDLVLFAPDAGFEVDIRGEDYLILRERDVHAVASSRTEGQTGLYL